MGGYGALRIGCKYPLEYAAISGHSSVTRFAELEQAVEEKMIWQGKEDLDVLTEAILNKDKLPSIRFDCGVDDFFDRRESASP